jgi:CO/xanthine dehydrogenase FAD-binding subunit
MTLDAVAVLHGPDGQRELPVDDFFVADGIQNTQRGEGELVTEIRVPLASAERKMAYAKLRQRSSIDFPLLTVAVSAAVEGDGVVRDIRGVVTALGSRPRTLTGWDDIAAEKTLDDQVVEELAQRAHKQCHPLENIIVDPEWRRAMVPVYVRRALEQVRAA